MTSDLLALFEQIWNPNKSSLLKLTKDASTEEWSYLLSSKRAFISETQPAGIPNYYSLRHIHATDLNTLLQAGYQGLVNAYPSTIRLYYGVFSVHSLKVKVKPYLIYVLGDTIATQVDSAELSAAIAQSRDYLIKRCTLNAL